VIDGDLVVRPCSADDAPELAKMYALDRAEIERAEPGRAPTFFTVDGQRDRITRLWPEVRALGYVVLERDEIVALFLFEDATTETAIVGYYVAAPHRRQGIATRALKQMIDIGFHEVGLQTIIADIEPHNAASLRVVDSNGFRDAGTAIVGGVEHRRFLLGSDLP
jgi:ribosomal-protein-alanine N-acetyltransferase